MISIICGTNRPGSLTGIYAKKFYEIFNEKAFGEVQYLSLEDLPNDMIHSGMYASDTQASGVTELQDKYILGADAFFILSPEYNGSFPGVLKTFIDAVSIRDYAGSFKGKKVGLFGVASGRAGNLRGNDHLTGVMNHVGCTVMPKAVPFGQAQTFLDVDKNIVDENTLKMMDEYAGQFLDFVKAVPTPA